MRAAVAIVAALAQAAFAAQERVSPATIPHVLPAPDYMVDNTRNLHRVAPDKGTLRGPVVAQADGEKLSRLFANNGSSASDGAHNATMFAARAPGILEDRQNGGFWMETIAHGQMPYQPGPYAFFRNVKDYGAKGDGVTDDTAAINLAVSAGNRCGEGCGSTTIAGALVYFPPGTYMLSTPVIQLYYTQFVGDPSNRAILKGMSTFKGIALVDTDVYIPGGNGSEWYINQNQFYRQIRNLVFDLTAMPNTIYDGDQQYAPTGLHWQVAQATNLQNLLFNMPPNSGATTAVGIFMENGSGGFVSDLVFQGGNIGFRAGSQQFTARRLYFNGVNTAISMIWDWGFTWKSIVVENCWVAIDCQLFGGGPDAQGTGSITLLDSTFINVPYAIPVNADFLPTLVIDNLYVQGVQWLVYESGSTNFLLVDGATYIQSWAMGPRYLTVDGKPSYGYGYLTPPQKDQSLLDGNGKFFERLKPQYETVSSSTFIVATDYFGIRNDGTGDQTAAINQLLQTWLATPIFFPAGVYLVEGTVFVPTGSVLVGEGWSQIMGTGQFFADAVHPQPVVRFGNPGDVGTMEVSDFLFTVRGPTAGAIVVQWNVKQSFQGAAGMWDCHVRVGGAIGSNLQQADCPKLSGTAKPECHAASMLLHVTSSASGYFENVWTWTADHDIDEPPSGDDTGDSQIDIYAARGMLIESSSGPVWLYGTGSEHNVFYQYQFAGARNVYAGHMQSETPYWQPAPSALDIWQPGAGGFAHDPTFSTCGTDVRCVEAWALRLIESNNIYIYGAGFYNFFDSYSQDCLDTESCQLRIIETSYTQGLWLYEVYTKGAVQPIFPQGGVVAPVLQADANIQHGFTTEIAAWLPLAQYGAGVGGGDDVDGGGDGGDGIVYADPSIWNQTNPSVCCEPPCTIILPPKQLPTATTISIPLYTTSLTEWCSGTQTVVTTTLTIPPVTTTAIDFWNVNVTVAPTTVVAESSIQPPPFYITESCNGLVSTFYPRPYPYETPSATQNNPTVSICSGKAQPTCTHDCGHHCDIFCVGPCLWCIPCIGCGPGPIPPPPPPIPPPPGGDDDDCTTITTSACLTIVTTAPTIGWSSTCSIILDCEPTPTNGIIIAAPVYEVGPESWPTQTSDRAATASLISSMRSILSTKFPTTTSTLPTPTPTQGIVLYTVDKDVVESGTTSSYWLITDLSGDYNTCLALSAKGTNTLSQPFSGHDVPRNWTLTNPILGGTISGCVWTSMDEADGQLDCPGVGTFPCPPFDPRVAYTCNPDVGEMDTVTVLNYCYIA